MKEIKKLPQEPRQKVWILFRHTNDLISKYFDDTLTEEKGISYQQFMVLLAMALTGCNATATVLSDQLDRNPNTLSTILDRMQKNGLVKKLRDIPDRRNVRVVMTAKGKARFGEGLKVSVGIIKKLTAAFTDDELETFASLISKLEKATSDEMARQNNAIGNKPKSPVKKVKTAGVGQ
ncbi:MAG: MarR family winged helix-turn-helix transcriptional regulator [Dehalococcoidia bacterium]|nr:MarR family winged helix-turn-helix transcriptional regulator [Dehalococcoidia bacterium]